jgi:hypothetical protein
VARPGRGYRSHPSTATAPLEQLAAPAPAGQARAARDTRRDLGFRARRLFRARVGGDYRAPLQGAAPPPPELPARGPLLACRPQRAEARRRRRQIEVTSWPFPALPGQPPAAQARAVRPFRRRERFRRAGRWLLRRAPLEGAAAPPATVGCVTLAETLFATVAVTETTPMTVTATETLRATVDTRERQCSLAP